MRQNAEHITEKLLYLFSFLEKELEAYLWDVLDHTCWDLGDSAYTCFKYIRALAYANIDLGEPPHVHSLKDYFADVPKREYRKFVRRLKKECRQSKKVGGEVFDPQEDFTTHRPADLDIDSVLLLLDLLYPSFKRYIDAVLQDHEEDPCHSAVAPNSLIKVYIEIMAHFGKALPYSTVREYFAYVGYTEQEYDQFQAVREKEAVYYGGKQY